MGLTNNTSNQSKIVTIVKGKFAIRLPDGSDDPKGVERTLEKGANAGKVIKELQYTGIEGRIKSCYVDETEYGANFITNMEDDEGAKFLLQIPLDSQFFSQYAKRMPNIDKEKPIFFGLGYDRERERHFLYSRQNNEKVSMKFTKDNPNGLPQPSKKTVKGKEVWVWDEQENFLYEVAMDFIGTFDSGVKKVVETFNAKATEDIPF
tara:strand:- start:66 stop:683 length:618 start_codon:yes stop_codon:yes gene_type:complete